MYIPLTLNADGTEGQSLFSVRNSSTAKHREEMGRFGGKKFCPIPRFFVVLAA